MSKFSPCRYCGENGQRFSFDEHVRMGQEPLYSDFYVICKCGNRTSKIRGSFDGALEQWNEENPTEPKPTERICKNCMHRVGTTYICEFQNEEVDPLHTCSEFLGW